EEAEKRRLEREKKLNDNREKEAEEERLRIEEDRRIAEIERIEEEKIMRETLDLKLAKLKVPKIFVNKKHLVSDAQMKNKSISDFLTKFEDYLHNEAHIDEYSKIMIAVSGGVDSMSLLDALANLAHEYKFKLYVAHYNHKLRGLSSDADEELVRKTADKYNIPYYKSTGNVRQHSEKLGLSLELAARNLRYRFFERMAKTLKVNYIVTGHTSDDTAETFLLNLIRGSGITGLSGIPRQRYIGKNISIVRPYLNMRKQEIIRYAKARKLKWNEDESNSLLFFTRNKVRHDLIPKLKDDYSPAIIDVINRTSKLLRGADNYISEQVQKMLQSVIRNKVGTRFSVLISLFNTFDEFIQGEVLQTALTSFYKMQNVSMQTIDRILELLQKPTGALCEVNKSIIALRDRDYIIFDKKKENFNINLPINKSGEFVAGNAKLILSKVAKKDINYDDSPNVEYFDADLLPSRLYIRSYMPGDAFQPLGMTGTMKISDFLTNEKMPLIDKPYVLMLATQNDIAWICGKRISDKFKITDDTKNVVKAEYIITDK
ncbi:MAG: tRNA lysidine(34) synthetase TilS, partial [Chlorobi bacterium]|nr:tRNA lysidine(34) synthetase TilS [Chlorobiota bacterium]